MYTVSCNFDTALCILYMVTLRTLETVKSAPLQTSQKRVLLQEESLSARRKSNCQRTLLPRLPVLQCSGGCWTLYVYTHALHCTALHHSAVSYRTMQCSALYTDSGLYVQTSGWHLRTLIINHQCTKPSLQGSAV